MPHAHPDWMRDLRLTELLVELRPAEPWRLPSDLALLQRSILGRAVFDLCCVREHRDCKICELADRCEIPTWYDPGRSGSHDPRPLIPVPLTPGGALVTPHEPLQLRWWLLGRVPRPSLLVESLIRMARQGLGPDRVPHRLTQLHVRGQGPMARVVSGERLRDPWPAPGRLSSFIELPEQVSGAWVEVLSPLCWKDARPDRAPTVGDALWTAISRIRQVMRAQDLPQPPPWEDPRGYHRPWDDARWSPGKRRSSQGGEHDLSGWLGGFSLRDELWRWADVLAAAELLGCGLATSAGRGRIQVRWHIPGT